MDQRCATIDALGRVTGTIVADPDIHAPHYGFLLAACGPEVDAGWMYDPARGFYLTDAEQGRRDAIEDAGAPIPRPVWEDGEAPHDEETAASHVLKVTEARITALQTMRGAVGFEPYTHCPGFTWASSTLEASDDCRAFVEKMARDVQSGSFDPNWALDFILVNASLLPPELAGTLIAVLPRSMGRLARRYVEAAQ